MVMQCQNPCERSSLSLATKFLFYAILKMIQSLVWLINSCIIDILSRTFAFLFNVNAAN